MTTEFIPWSKSRNAKRTPKTNDRSLNWRVAIVKDGREVLATDYSAGIAHCPSYSGGAKPTLAYAEAIAFETETGRSNTMFRKAIMPDFADVLYSLANDAGVIDARSFEEWAGDFGLDADSRKAEAMYRACLETALKLRNGIGGAGLAKLREACQDY